MADIPQYERKTGIQPQQAATGFGQAFGSLAQVSLQAAEMGNQAAQGASQELAKIQAREAAKTPGKTLIPAITNADKAYHQIYQQEEYQNQLFAGQQLIQSNHTLVARDPTVGGLEAFRKNTLSGLQQIVGASTDENKQNLYRALVSSYDSNQAQLEKAVYAKSKKEGIERTNYQISRGTESIRDKQISGDPQEAERLYEEVKESIFAAEARKDLNQEQSWAYLMLAKQAHDGGALEAQALKELENHTGKELDNLKQYVLNSKDTIQEKEQNVRQTLQTIGMYQTVDATNKDLLNLQARLDLDTGALDAGKALYYQQQMNPVDFLKLQIAAANQRKADTSASDTLQFIQANPGNAGAQSSLSGKQLDGAAELQYQQYSRKISELTGQPEAPLSWEQKVQATSGGAFAIPPPSLVKGIQQGILNGAAAEKITAANALDMAVKINPNLANEVGSDARNYAQIFKQGLAGGATPQDAAKDASNAVLNVTDTVQKDRMLQWETFSQKEGLNNYDDLKSYAAKAMGFSKGSLPSGFASTFESRFKANWLSLGAEHQQQAKANTIEQISRTYNKSAFNGDPDQVMYLPPESFMEFGGYESQIIRQQMVEHLERDYFSNERALYEQGLTDVYHTVDIPTKRKERLNFEAEGLPLIYESVPEEKVVITEIHRDGTMRQGLAKIRADDLSNSANNQDVPYYQVQWEVDGKLLNPINNYAAIEGLRFRWDKAEVRQQFIKENGLDEATKQENLQKHILEVGKKRAMGLDEIEFWDSVRQSK